MSTVFHNARIFQSQLPSGTDHSFAECMIIDHATGTISYVGSSSDHEVAKAAETGATQVDLGNKVVLPAFMDSHMHLLLLGLALKKLSLEPCKNLDDIREKIRIYAEENPHLPRILCRGWMQPMTNGLALASMLEGLDSKGRPIFIDSRDLHSTWCNDAAIAEMGAHDLPDPVGGTIHRDEHGVPSGLFSEGAAIGMVWPHISRVATVRERADALQTALNAYTAAGYTGVVDMAMDERIWEALVLLQEEHDLPIRIAANWLILPKSTDAENLAQVDRAIELHAKYNAQTSPRLRIAGIKLVCDGVVDGCTATLTEPYSTTNTSADPLWSVEAFGPVVKKADSAGLQCALHAIGDLAVKNAIDALEQNATPNHRHRIEHLELTSEEDAKRLGKLGITASIQPVHADPAILRAWPRLLGERRCKRAFAYREFLDGGATLAIGTDSPTAPYHPLPNLYTATTRLSVREPASKEKVNEHFALELASAVSGATSGAAYSCFADGWTGQIKKGLKADFVVMDMEWSSKKLLEAKVRQTWFEGQKVFDAEAVA